MFRGCITKSASTVIILTLMGCATKVTSVRSGSEQVRVLITKSDAENYSLVNSEGAMIGTTNGSAGLLTYKTTESSESLISGCLGIRNEKNGEFLTGESSSKSLPFLFIDKVGKEYRSRLSQVQLMKEEMNNLTNTLPLNEAYKNGSCSRPPKKALSLMPCDPNKVTTRYATAFCAASTVTVRDPCSNLSEKVKGNVSLTTQTNLDAIDCNATGNLILEGQSHGYRSSEESKASDLIEKYSKKGLDAGLKMMESAPVEGATVGILSGLANAATTWYKGHKSGQNLETCIKGVTDKCTSEYTAWKQDSADIESRPTRLLQECSISLQRINQIKSDIPKIEKEINKLRGTIEETKISDCN